MSEVKAKRTRKALPPSPDFVSMREVASYCCVAESTVSRGSRQGVWPFSLLRRVEIGARVIFTRASFNHMARVLKASADIVSIEEGRKLSA